MKYLLSALAILTTAAGFAVSAVAPNAYTATEANGSFFLFSSTTTRTYQIVIDESQLTSLIGLELNSINMRIGGGSAAWPPVDFTVTDFDVYLGASVDPTARVAVFADNFLSTPTQVRDGALNILAGSYGGGLTPNAFGPDIAFDSGYIYNGGDLGLELRYTNNTSGINPSFDAVTTGAPEDDILVSSGWTGSNTGTTGSLSSNSIVFQFNGEPVPEPATMIALGAGLAALAARRRGKA